jgi:hypothetical protein
MIEKVIFDHHSHQIEEEDNDDDNNAADGGGGEISLINVNNNYNITIPAKDVNGVKEIISLNASALKKLPSRLGSNIGSGSQTPSASLCK